MRDAASTHRAGLPARAGLLLLIGASILMACSAGAIPVRDTAQVRSWLNSMPFQDAPRGGAPPVAPAAESWEAWTDRGREITGVEGKLLRMLEAETDAFTRARIVVALGAVGTQASVKAVTAVLASDVPMVQMEAAATLGRLGKGESVEPLCAALNSSDPNVRANASTALGEIGGETAVACLRQALQDSDPFVQSAARAALGKPGK